MRITPYLPSGLPGLQVYKNKSLAEKYRKAIKMWLQEAFEDKEKTNTTELAKNIYQFELKLHEIGSRNYLKSWKLQSKLSCLETILFGY